jgi:hypothetical protein
VQRAASSALAAGPAWLGDPGSLPSPDVPIAKIQEEMAAILKQFGGPTRAR